MAVRYQKARILIAGSVAAAVVAGTAYFAQPQPQPQPQAAASSVTTTVSMPSQTIQGTSPATTVKQPAIAPAKAKKTRGS